MKTTCRKMMKFFSMLSAITMAAPAMASTPPLPDMLLWKGKPIEPYCFKTLIPQEQDDSILLDLNKCKLPANVTVVPSEPEEAGQKNTWYDYGYDYNEKEPDMPEPSGSPQTIGYRFYGMLGDLAIVNVAESGGGSGLFDNVLSLKRDGDALKVVKYLVGGDRCNGGIKRITVENGGVTIDQNITPADLIDISGFDPHHLNTEDSSLDQSAASCLGVKRVHDGKIIAFIPNAGSIHRNPEKSEPPGEYQAKYQDCFDKLMGGIPNTNPWSMAQIKEFSRHFNRACVEKKGS